MMGAGKGLISSGMNARVFFARCQEAEESTSGVVGFIHSVAGLMFAAVVLRGINGG